MISRLDELIEHNSDFIWEVDENGVYTYVNSVAKELMGYEPSELIGKTPFDFMPKKEKSRVETIFKEYVEKKAKFKNIENLNITKDGKEIVLETSGVPILSKDNKLIGYRGIDRDITKQVQLKKELEDKNKLLEELIQTQSKMATMGEMVDKITQQLRSPLNQINTIASGIRLQKELGVFDEKSLDELLQKIEHNIEFLSQIVNEFRDFFSPNQAELYFDLKKSIKKALFLLKFEFKDIKIHVKKDLINLEMRGQENLLLQVLVNIIKSSKNTLIKNKKIKKKLIFIKNYKDDKNFYITIKDNAGGLKEKKLKIATEPNFSIKENNSTSIGLYMSKIIINKRLKGDLFVKNVSFEYKNKIYEGVEFIIKIPIK